MFENFKHWIDFSYRQRYSMVKALEKSVGIVTKADPPKGVGSDLVITLCESQQTSKKSFVFLYLAAKNTRYVKS